MAQSHSCTSSLLSSSIGQSKLQKQPGSQRWRKNIHLLLRALEKVPEWNTDEGGFDSFFHYGQRVALFPVKHIFTQYRTIQ